MTEYSCVSDESTDGDADVLVDAEQLLLIGRQLAAGALEGGDDDPFGRPQSHTAAALLHRLHRVLHLVQPTSRTERRHVRVILIAKHHCTAPRQAVKEQQRTR